MRHVFLDANILVAVLNKEYPAYTDCAKILSMAGSRNLVFYCSTLSLGIAYFFAEKKHGASSARSRIELLLQHIYVSNCGEKETKLAIENKKAHDFEDALQYYSAINADCKTIITLNVSDYYFANCTIQLPNEFLAAISLQ